MKYVAARRIVCVLLLYLTLHICRAGEYHLAVDMNGLPGKMMVGVQQNPPLISPTSFYIVGFNPDRPLFPRVGSSENSRIYKSPHPIGFQAELFQPNLMFSVYAMPIARANSAPFGDTTSKITEKSLQTGGFALAYMF
jgi:hypothetical protein